jgi:hypothetical protein
MLDLNTIPDLLLWLEGDDGFVDKSANEYSIINNGVFIEGGVVNNKKTFNFILANYLSFLEQIPKSDNFTIVAVVAVGDLDVGNSKLCIAGAVDVPTSTYYDVSINHLENGLSVSWGDGNVDYEKYSRSYMYEEEKFFLVTIRCGSDPFLGNTNTYNDVVFDMDYQGTGNDVTVDAPLQPFRIGGFADNNMKLAEFALYERYLDDLEIAILIDEMNSKYDLQLPTFTDYPATEGLPYGYALSGENLLGEDGEINISGLKFPHPLDVVSLENYSGTSTIGFRIIREKTGQTLAVIYEADFGKTLDMAHIGPNDLNLDLVMRIGIGVQILVHLVVIVHYLLLVLLL